MNTNKFNWNIRVRRRVVLILKSSLNNFITSDMLVLFVIVLTKCIDSRKYRLFVSWGTALNFPG